MISKAYDRLSNNPYIKTNIHVSVVVLFTHTVHGRPDILLAKCVIMSSPPAPPPPPSPPARSLQPTTYTSTHNP